MSSKEKTLLLSSLSDAVHQCHLRFHDRELATELDKRVVTLCLCLDQCLSHGIRYNKSIFRLTKEIASMGLNRSPPPSDQVCYWHFVKTFLNPHDIERYSLLKNVSTDIGRSRSWLRSCLNERSFHRYLSQMLCPSSISTRCHFYEEDALMRDPSAGDAILSHALTLTNLLFAINIDRIELNDQFLMASSPSSTINIPSYSGHRRRQPSENHPSPVFSPTSSIVTSVKLRRSNPRVVCLPEDEDSDPDLSSSYTTANVVGSCPTLPSALSEYRPQGSPSSSESRSTGATDGVQPMATQSFILNVTNDNNVTSTKGHVLLTPLEEDVGSIGRYSHPGDKTEEEEEDEEEDGHGHEPDQGGGDLMVNHLRKIIEDQKEELNLKRKELDDRTRKSDATIEELIKQNDLLKVQVKKYLSAIQLLKREGDNQGDGDEHVDVDGVVQGRDVLIHDEGNDYERKLIQVAEMHGELVEFNDRLHRVITQKDGMIKRLREELVELRGPLLPDPQNDESMMQNDITRSSISSGSPSGSLSNRPLINLWIPTAFLADQAKGTRHHVYQIYIRLKEEEWNVYRRYSQFYVMYRKMRKSWPSVSSLDFPPKKAFSNRDSRVVQERRKRLETFLRNLINIIMASEHHHINDRMMMDPVINQRKLGQEILVFTMAFLLINTWACDLK